MSGKSEWPEVIPIDHATGHFLSPDTSKTTRIDFTDFFQRFRVAADAHPAYKHLFDQQLAKLLIENAAMKPNLQQTFSTPANSKNKVYHMWDFILRTFQVLAAQVDPQAPFISPLFHDVLSRATMAKQLMLDDTGKLETMNASVGQFDDTGVEFGEETKKLAATLDKVGDLCTGCGKATRDDGKPLLICARCKDEQYCSTVCQKRLWKSHKKVCGGVKSY